MHPNTHIEYNLSFQSLIFLCRLQSNLRGVISNYEKAYLSKSLARLFDTVNQNFVTIPTKPGLDAILRIIRAEVLVDDPMLKRLMMRNVEKTVNLICVKAEQLVATDGSSTQVIGKVEYIFDLALKIMS